MKKVRNNDIQIFNNAEFGEIRTFVINEEPYFVGKDVAEILGYKNQNRDIVRHVDEDDRLMLDDKLNTETVSSLGQRGGWVINESGLYSLILSSKLPKAKEFKRWVTNEVLPTIRKTGGYVSDDEQFLNTYLPHADEQTKLLFKSNLMVIRNLNEKIEADKPKVLFADSVNNTEDNISMADMAKLLKQNGIDIGRQRLFAWLRDNNYLMKRRGINYNTPTQKGMNLNLFYLQESVVHRKDGSSFLQKTTRITPKGQTYLVNKFLQS